MKGTRPLALLLVLLAVDVAGAQSRSRSSGGLKTRLSNVRERKRDVRAELQRTRAAAKEVKADITVVDARLERIQDELELTASKLSDSRSEQQTLAIRLEAATRRLDEVKEQVRKRLRRVYLRQEGTYLGAVLGSRNMSDILSRQQIMEAVVRRDHEIFREFRSLVQEVAAKKRRQDQLVVQIRDLRGRQVRYQAHLSDTRSEKQQILGGLSAKQEELRRLIRNLEADEARIEGEIAAMIRRSRQAGSRKLPPMVGRFMRPASGPITSSFGMRFHPILKIRRMHKGVDIGAPMGAPIYAAADGEVVAARYSSSYGNVIILAHGSGLSTVYAHCSRIQVRAGMMVKAGQRIGSVGATGLARGAHLHWEVYQNGRAINPMGR